MDKPLAVVVSDETILPEICGANDSNLKVLEELLGVPVFSRGNEIFLDTSDDAIEKTFKLLLKHIEEHVRLGQLPARTSSGPCTAPWQTASPRRRTS